MKGYDRPLTLKEVGEVKDEDFWKNAEVVEPDRAEQVTLRVKRSVLDFFKAPGKGYQTRINRVLEAYVRARRGTPRPAAGIDRVRLRLVFRGAGISLHRQGTRSRNCCTSLRRGWSRMSHSIRRGGEAG